MNSESKKEISPAGINKWLTIALYLSLVTILYNLIEGLFSTWFGYGDRALALSGFGTDSFVEVISGIGILHMIIRMKKTPDIQMRDKFEDNALRVTGYSFYLLCAGLIIGSGMMFYKGIHPRTTLAGIIISGISIATMYALYKAKVKAGNILNSAPILADAECTKTCYYLSFVLLGASLSWELARVPYVDVAGSLGIAWFAYNEGKESFQKMKNRTFSNEETAEEIMKTGSN
jgi:divalent metal cation (Fe/Co/Zn/Cd) transporter